MKKRNLWYAALTGAMLAVLYGAPASAQATRTWVSGVGDDANPCSRTAPCKTFAGAISKTAANGEINCIDPGGFGAVTITKSITIDCGGTFGSVLAAGTNGIIVNAANVVVTIRNISINGAGTGLNGIRFLQGTALHVENVQIFNFTQKGIDFEPTTTAALFVTNSTITNNTTAVNGGGILVKPGAGVNATAQITNTRMDRNLFGLRVEDRGKATVVDSVADGNIGNGFVAVSAAAAAEINLVRSVASNTTTNGVATSGALATIRLYYSAVIDNGTGINTTGGGTVATTVPATNLNTGNTTPGAPNGTVTLQ